MKTLKEFPPEYQYVNFYVDRIDIPNLYFGTRGNDDFFVHLKDGNSYSFTAFTPDNIKQLMEQDNLKSFISPGLVLVQNINLESILDAIEECLKLSKHNKSGLDRFGVLQT
jgi:hypothetical protein